MATDPTPDSIIQHLLDRFEGTRVVEAWGERSIFYNPGRKLPRGVYFAITANATEIEVISCASRKLKHFQLLG